MSALGHVLGELFANAVGNIVGAAAAGSPPVERVARMARQWGYAVSGRSDQSLTLVVTTARGRRAVTVVLDDTLAAFATFSGFDQPSHRVPGELLPHLLTRSGKADAGGWFLAEHDNGNACFGMRYLTPTAGLDAAVLRYVVEGLTGEVDDFDARLEQARLL